ncbi:MAG: PAS domain-containing protein, partial [Candidatus Heimdallarchaeota archaeon]
KAVKHYLREENVLFPYIEKHGLSEPPAQMWIDHDKIRGLEKELFDLLEAAENKSMKFSVFKDKILKVVPSLANILSTHYYKENNILFPAAIRLLAQSEWKTVRQDFDEIGYCCFTPKEVTEVFTVEEDDELPEEVKQEGMVEFDTGPIPINFIEPILNSLPVDITFVDHEDKVRYFSKGDERLFIRAKAIIGRSVINCHPSKSYEIVERILTDFREGKRKSAEFWIDLAGKKIYIRYFAVHNKEGKYLGCIEVSQDITEIQKIEGQKRLLD